MIWIPDKVVEDRSDSTSDLPPVFAQLTAPTKATPPAMATRKKSRLFNYTPAISAIDPKILKTPFGSLHSRNVAIRRDAWPPLPWPYSSPCKRYTVWGADLFAPPLHDNGLPSRHRFYVSSDCIHETKTKVSQLHFQYEIRFGEKKLKVFWEQIPFFILIRHQACMFGLSNVHSPADWLLLTKP